MILFVLLIGLVIGSFLNVCIYRIAREESISYPPSHCTSCGYELKWKDLVPVISYLFIRGKCRMCKEKISIRYPIVELVNGIIYCIVIFKIRNYNCIYQILCSSINFNCYRNDRLRY